MTIKLLICATLAFGVAETASAHDSHAQDSDVKITLAQSVVPEAEYDRARELLADGPTKTSGIGGVKLLGTVPLDGEFGSSDGLVMRVRELLIEPGGIVAVHRHDRRPGTAYIIDGEMTEHRSTDGPDRRGHPGRLPAWAFDPRAVRGMDCGGCDALAGSVQHLERREARGTIDGPHRSRRCRRPPGRPRPLVYCVPT